MKCDIGPLADGCGNLVSDPKAMGEILQNQYCGVFSDSNNPDKVIPLVVRSTKLISDINFTIENAIDDIDQSSATSENNIPAIVLKKCKLHLSYPIYCVWTKSMDTGLIPPTLKSLKNSTLLLSTKKGNKTDPANYRPVSLTSHLINI